MSHQIYVTVVIDTHKIVLFIWCLRISYLKSLVTCLFNAFWVLTIVFVIVGRATFYNLIFEKVKVFFHCYVYDRCLPLDRHTKKLFPALNSWNLFSAATFKKNFLNLGFASQCSSFTNDNGNIYKSYLQSYKLLLLILDSRKW